MFACVLCLLVLQHMFFALLDEHLPDHCVFEHKEKKMVHSMFREVLEGKQSSTGGDRGNKKMVRAHDRV